MALLDAMTELEAVNLMLLSIGQTPVNSLAVTGINDVNVARQNLQRITRQVQTTGWFWNTDRNYKLTPDIDGDVLAPAGALRIRAMGPVNNLILRRHPTKNGMALWNTDDNTFTFPQGTPVEVEVVWGFSFEDLPESARSYVGTKAGRQFQARVVGSPILDRFEAVDEATAWAQLVREERAARKTNLFRNNTGLQQLTRRR